MNIIEGKLIAEGQKIAIVAGRFNEIITNKLLGGAVDAFKRHGGDEKDIDLAWVPGAFEIPLVAKKYGAWYNAGKKARNWYVQNTFCLPWQHLPVADGGICDEGSGSEGWGGGAV